MKLYKALSQEINDMVFTQNVNRNQILNASFKGDLIIDKVIGKVIFIIVEQGRV